MEFICDTCDKCFSNKYNLSVHVKRGACLKRQKNRFLCAQCGKTFSTKSNCGRHIAKGKCIVSIKSNPTTANKKHESKKKKDANVETLEFGSNAEFLLWKDDIEQKTLSKYSQSSSAWQTKTGIKIRYWCHRAGLVRIKESTARKRSLKRKGSCKINNKCSACILYEECKYSGKVTVQYNPVHCNHALEMKHLPISSVVKDNIAEKLRSGVPLDQILDEIRESLHDENFTRTQLITKHELHNIMAEKRISYQEGKSSVDTESVESIIEEYRSKYGKDSPFKYYKELGEKNDLDVDDFLLVIMNSVQISLMKQYGCNKICVDSALLTKNCDFHLNTILVVNNLNMVVPVAHAISNKENSELMRKFFEVIRQECGVIRTNVFMSDDFPLYLNTWTMVMEEPKNILLSQWHVDKNWCNNLKLVNGSKDLKDKVYKLVRTLMEEMNEDSFPEIVISAVKKLIIDHNTMDFGRYFESEYSKRYEMWAFAFRKYIGMSTNRKFEAMHKELQNVYSHGLKSNKLGKLITTLLKMNRNKAFDRVSHFILEPDSRTLKKVKNRHISGTKIPTEDVSILSDATGNVRSQRDKSTIYEIKKIAESCSCTHRCEDCQICVHLYECTCDDYVFEYNICEHIHAFAVNLHFLVSSIKNNEYEVDTEVNDIYQILEIESSVEVQSVPQTRDCIETIAKEIIEINRCCEDMEMNDEDMGVLSILDRVKETLLRRAQGVKGDKQKAEH